LAHFGKSRAANSKECVRRTKLKLRETSIGKGKKMWCCTWPRVGVGRNRQFFTDRAAATTFRKQKQIDLEDHGRAGMALTDSQRNMFHECAEELRPFGRTIRDATKHFVEHLKATDKSITAQALVAEFLEAKKQDGVSASQLNSLKRLKRFANHFNGRQVASITSGEIDSWLRSLPVGPCSKNHHRQFTNQAFNFAIRNHYAASNPAAGAPKVKVVSGPPGIFTVEQATALLQNSGDEIRPYIAIGLFAGLRPAETERLDWREIDFESGLIEVTAAKAKTASRRLVPIQPNLREWLLPLRRERGNVTPKSCFRQMSDAARKAAEISAWPHDALRHSFASYHIAHFKNMAETALNLGHTDARVTAKHYREVVKPSEAEQYWQITP
jgi:integrase